MAKKPAPVTKFSDTELEAFSTEREADELGALWARLSVKQQQFLTHRLAGMTIDEASKRLGWSLSMGKQMSTNPLLKRYMQVATRRAVRRTMLTREDVIHGLLDAVDSAGSSADLTQAWREIGRLIGAYEPEKVDVTVTVADLDPQRLSSMSTHELLKMTQVDGVYVVDAEEDPARQDYALLREALAPPTPRQALGAEIEEAEVRDVEA